MRRFSPGETLFSQLFKIGRDRHYRVAWQWDARETARFFALKPRHKNLFLSAVGVMVLGLAFLAGEVGLWAYRHLSVELYRKQNLSLNRDLQTVQAEQKTLESTLDSLTGVEEKIRALYGMNAYDRS